MDVRFELALIAAEMDPAGAVHIEVSDDGPGMDPDELKRAMQPYQRGKAGRGREGTGLGLPLARALIARELPAQKAA